MSHCEYRKGKRCTHEDLFFFVVDNDVCGQCHLHSDRQVITDEMREEMTAAEAAEVKAHSDPLCKHLGGKSRVLPCSCGSRVQLYECNENGRECVRSSQDRLKAYEADCRERPELKAPGAFKAYRESVRACYSCNDYKPEE